ncbi:CDP-alcohol phosphatidyltransferase family protein [Rugosimonospora africana]|uniref:Phosphatidylglycerophosphate synthase n=1 Tax=Rugosimonospora africana TaxID=556532 RepID=A0A8J3VRL4_9ACTN|nr:CDP-alcohol phosphatidyltransferase family protein [Rugosimonospora africana]GIH16239.1 hypothetical protein Raf01_44110 [Rugosimonospora africana]
MTGLLVQVALVLALAATVGMGAAGWLAGIGYGLVVCAALTRGLHRSGATSLGPANWVTLTRATLIGGVTALTADSFRGHQSVRALVTLTIVALLLDAVDGQVARRSGTVSPLGASFDMEADAYLLLVLSVYVAPLAGVWVLAIGGMRYAFLAASWVLPWMRRKLPFRYWRKVVTAAQGVALVVASTNVLPKALTIVALAVALALLVESFGRDVLWLWCRRTRRPRPTVTLANATLAAVTVATATQAAATRAHATRNPATSNPATPHPATVNPATVNPATPNSGGPADRRTPHYLPARLPNRHATVPSPQSD